MSDTDDKGPDFSRGVSLAEIADGGVLAGHVSGTSVLLFRRGDAVFAVDASCTHLGAPLAEGLIEGTRIQCPWHHAWFDLCNGEAVEAPAFDPLGCWEVEARQGEVFVHRKRKAATAARRQVDPQVDPRRFVIVGGGAAGFAAADQLRRKGFDGGITMVSAETAEPYDRTLLTKDYLDGSFGDDRLRIAGRTLASLDVEFLSGTRAVRLDPGARQLHLADGRAVAYDALLLATGGTPKRPEFDGADAPHVHLLRSLADCRAILAAAAPGAKLIVLGGSFIALEAAASLRERGLDVTIVAQEDAPLAKIFGSELAAAVRRVHEQHGNRFEVGRTIKAVANGHVRLDDGREIACDLLVAGIGIAPATELAEAAGLVVENGITVDARLATSDPAIYAAGDIACWPDPHSGARIRVEHWVVAERHGQVAAHNMLGGEVAFEDVPYFWTKHFDFAIRYIGHATDWNAIEIDGDLDQRDATLRYVRNGRVLAVATVGRDKALLVEKRRMTAGRAPRSVQSFQSSIPGTAPG